MKPVFRYGWAAFSAILGGRLLYALFWESFQNGLYFTVLPMILCMIVGGAVGYYTEDNLPDSSYTVTSEEDPFAALAQAAAEAAAGAE